MKPGIRFGHAAKPLISLMIFVACPLILQGQAKKSTPAPAPAPPAKVVTPPPKVTPPPARGTPPAQQPQKQQPQTGGTGKGGGTGSATAGGAGSGGKGGGSGTGAGTGPGTGGRGGSGSGNGGGAGGRGGAGSGAGSGNGGKVGNGSETGGTGNGGRGGSGTAGTPPKPTLTPNPRVVKTVPGANGSKVGLDAKGNKVSVTTQNGTQASLNSKGQVSKIQTANGTTVMHNASGGRTVISERVSASGVHYKVVNAGPHQTYVERPFSAGGHDYVRRTYWRDGHSYVSVYRGYRFGGRTYYRYVPAYYYGPRFYGWAYAGWSSPVYYSWGWYGAPWYTPYGYYFTPYNSYPSAAFWLTDYVVAESLRAAYEAQAPTGQPPTDLTQAEPGPANSQADLTPDIKQMIADEVKSQLAAEQAAAQTSSQGGSAGASDSQAAVQSTDEVPPALDPNFKVFVVTTNMDVQSDGQGCSLSPGDVIERTEVTADKDDTVGVTVLKSQKTSCKSGSLSRLQVPDLQEMVNQFLGKMDDGVKALADNQGKKGLPSSQVAALTTDNSALKGLPTAPDNVATELKKQSDEANQAEVDVQQAMKPAVSIGQ